MSVDIESLLIEKKKKKKKASILIPHKIITIPKRNAKGNPHVFVTPAAVLMCNGLRICVSFPLFSPSYISTSSVICSSVYAS